MKISRILCLFNRHNFMPMNCHSRYKDGELVYCDMTSNCTRCGKQSERAVIYKKGREFNP